MENENYNRSAFCRMKLDIQISGYDMLKIAFLIERFVTQNKTSYKLYKKWSLKILRNFLQICNSDIEKEIIERIERIKNHTWIDWSK